jgi:pimeloyl-ACP methyl ester carboxylesterase
MLYEVLQTKSGSVGYVKVGHGLPMVMVLRYGATLYNWDNIFIQHLSQHFTLYLIDPPLVGRTTGDIPPNVSGYATLVYDVIDSLSLADVILFGWSFGGAVVQEFYRLFPASIAGLVLLSSFADSRLANQEFIQMYISGEELSRDKKLRMFELMFSQKPSSELNTKIQQSGLKIDSYSFRLEAAAMKLHNKFVLSWPGSTKENLAAIKVPTLILKSRNDHVFGQNAVEPFINNIPKFKFIDYARGGHLFIHFYPSEVAMDIINYFK